MGYAHNSFYPTASQLLPYARQLPSYASARRCPVLTSGAAAPRYECSSGYDSGSHNTYGDSYSYSPPTYSYFGEKRRSLTHEVLENLPELLSDLYTPSYYGSDLSAPSSYSYHGVSFDVCSLLDSPGIGQVKSAICYALTTRCPVLTQRAVLPGLCASTDDARRPQHPPGTWLRAQYCDIRYRLRGQYAMSSTETASRMPSLVRAVISGL